MSPSFYTLMHYNLTDHIYISQFREDLILLDTKADTYTICSPQLSDLLIKLLDNTLTETTAEDLDMIQSLVDENTLEEKEIIYPFFVDRKCDSKGVSDVDWKLPLENKGVSFNSSVLKAFMTLLQVHLYLKTRGFYATIQLIKRARKLQLTYSIPPDKALKDLANIVNKACLIYPIRTKCLEWAMTFVLLALKRKWKCNLEIGVQNYPFFAHAWVECDGKVIMDSPEVRTGLSIILNEPFRKLK